MRKEKQNNQALIFGNWPGTHSKAVLFFYWT
jgi:hypothetical protein